MNSKASFLIGKLSIDRIVVLAIAFASFIILLKFHTQFESAEQQIAQMKELSLSAQRFIANDCRYQFYRQTNAFTRLHKIVQLDGELYKANHIPARRDILALDEATLKTLKKTTLVDPACPTPKTNLTTFIHPPTH